MWQDQARCVGADPELFFPAPSVNAFWAKRICAECPVRTECLQWALEVGDDDAVLGGTSARQRRGMKPATQISWCGSRRGYLTHRREGTDPCDPCEAASRAYYRENDQKRRDREKGLVAA